jgi:FkbM family methyltransferase
MSVTSSAALLLPDSVFVRLIAVAHRRFEPELDAVVGAYPRGGTAIDVGTWFGPWTRSLAKRANRVVSFEPNPDVAAVLAKTLPANVELVRSAASDHTGTATLCLPPGGRGTEGRASLEGVEGATRMVEVPLQPVDDVVDRLNLSDVRFMKVDVEGHELAAIRGAQRLLTSQHPVLAVELEERHGGISPVVELVGELGYVGYVMVGTEWQPLTGFDLAGHQRAHATTATGSYLKTAIRRGERYINNVVFVHPESSWSVTRRGR